LSSFNLFKVRFLKTIIIVTMKLLLVLAFLVSCFLGQSCAAMGGLVSIDEDSEEAKQVANFATMRFCDRLNSPYHLKLMKIEDAKKQLVAGHLYHLRLIMGETNCLKSTDMMACEQVPGDQNRQWTCNIKVLHQAYNDQAPMKVVGEPVC